MSGEWQELEAALVGVEALEAKLHALGSRGENGPVGTLSKAVAPVYAPGDREADVLGDDLYDL